MNEQQAKDWLRDELDVSRETIEQLDTFLAYLAREAQSQNLIAASTLDTVWTRHVVDSAQLLKLLPAGHNPEGTWLDLGTGAGFPGLIAGILTKHRITLVESRRRRIEYLERAIAMLDLEERVRVAGVALGNLETAKFDVISARAFAPLPRLLAGAARFSTENTLWLLPKGRNAVKELQEAKDNWPLDFHIEPSITDTDAGILVGRLRGNTPKSAKKGGMI